MIEEYLVEGEEVRSQKTNVFEVEANTLNYVQALSFYQIYP